MSVAYDDKTVARVRALLAGRRGVAEKAMMGSLAFMVNGSMCCAVGSDGILFRIDVEDRQAVLARAHVAPMTMGARTMKGFVRVAPAGYRTAAALAKWIEGGIAAGGAKPKRPPPKPRSGR